MSHPYHRKFFDFYCFVHLRKPTDIPLKATFAIPNRYGYYYYCSSFKIQTNNDKTFHKSHSLQLGLIQKNDVEQSVTRKMECKKVPSTVVMEMF